jgi:hypothetical protein
MHPVEPVKLELDDEGVARMRFAEAIAAARPGIE